MKGTRQILIIAVSLTAVMGLTACDKVSELTNTAKSWWNGEDSEAVGKNATVDSVDKTEQQEIIANESRLVIVEYYSDT